MRLLAFVVISALLAGSVHAQVDIKRVWPEYRQADSFERISEYFTRKEDTSGQTILRTKPEHREGYYFLVRYRNKADAFEEALLQLSVIDATSPETRTYSFKTKLASGSNVLNVGLTGGDWPRAELSPVAWEVRLVAPDGRELAKKQSFLWAKPPGDKKS